MTRPDDWELFGLCIQAYSRGLLTRENFCRAWKCAQDVRQMQERLAEGGIYDTSE